MLPESLVIVGAGGHGREMLEVIRAINSANDNELFRFLGFLDDGGGDIQVLSRIEAEVLGAVEDLCRLEASYLIGIGNGHTRRKIDRLASSMGRTPARAVHPNATLGSDIQLGPGFVAMAGARATTNIALGRHVHLNQNCTVAHDCVIGNFVTINPGANVSGNVTLGDEVTVGTNASIIQGVKIGERTSVGAGAVVTRDLPADVTAVGVPAEPLRR